ncbi:MAG: sulfur-carrier protein [Clostridia bacterium]|uniref:Archaeal molybdopterin converting factor subunit 1 n=1 Tax=Thermacetogenium phaeum TaxID=85874 RepID=A0A124FK36_9THEO|nr:MAG: archaeal molybdopterin converting factor subunit 1 [Thermacetogenium phaeum]MDK2881295.1 sulfur-carrier protein [Clostridia bacterium]MDN5365148.1 sulfur-carrier protein [Thermacetogenium sp.]
MKVKFFALLRDITGVKETTDFTATVLVELLEKLSDHYGKELTRWLFAPTDSVQEKQLSSDVIILVNGRAIEHLSGLMTPLREDDEVAIFPRLAGG